MSIGFSLVEQFCSIASGLFLQLTRVIAGRACTMIDLANIANTLTNSLNSSELWPSPTWLITFILLVAIIRLLKVFSFPEKPDVTYRHKTSVKGEISIAEVLEKCPILNEM